MKGKNFLLLLLSLLAVFLTPSKCPAHGFAGKRFFPTTFQVDDPFISDEFSILINNMKSGTPSANSTEINIDYSKRLAPRFGLEFHDAYQHITSAGGDANGWEDLDVGAKWQFLTNEEHEAIASFGTNVEIGGTGAHQVSDSFSTVSPALFFGKGFPEFPMQTNFSRDDKGLTTGTVNPGVVWFGKSMELGVAAQVPVNSRSGRGVGVLGLVHLFIDDLWPAGIGGPIFH